MNNHSYLIEGERRRELLRKEKKLEELRLTLEDVEDDIPKEVLDTLKEFYK